MGFSLNDIMQQAEKKKEKTVAAPKVHMIHYSKLHRSPHQFYNEKDIEELAEAIRIGKGIKQPLIVARLDSAIGEYEIIAGHRRRLASIYLTEECGEEGYEFLPCIISTDEDVINRINLILTNRSVRKNLSPVEQLREMTDLEALFREFEKETGEKLNARETRKALAEGLKTSETRIANLQSINRNLCDEGKKKLQENKIGISAATELAGLSEEQQQELLGRQGELTVKSIKEEKKKNVSDSDTEMQAEENVSDSDTILPGQVDIHDYKEIAPNGFSRAEKVATLKQCVKECRMALDFLHDDSREPEVRKTKLLYQTQMEAYGKYIEYLQSDIQE